MNVTQIKEYTLFPDRPWVSLIAYHGVSHIRNTAQASPAVLIFPGGAYWMCDPCEQEPVAARWLAAGYQVFLLKYSVTKDKVGHIKYPQQLLEAATALKFIKDNAAEWGVDPNAVFIMGFSAGGHLCACLGTMYDSLTVLNTLSCPAERVKPRGMVLGYPVITGGKYIHQGSFNNLLWEDAQNPEILSALSAENCVTGSTVPTFLWACAPDAEVSCQNTLKMASALSEHKICFELHIYPVGNHGTTVTDAPKSAYENMVYAWYDDALRWMDFIQKEH